jgi:NAD(P)-dependent dehydrogenase (short-subunit alcohol dehydrogenase family)
MQAEIAQMLTQGGGAIVNTASIAGLVGGFGGAYSAAKHGVVGLTRVAALEYATRGIRVNAVCPGGIRTPMLERVFARRPETEQQFVAGEPIGRLGTPEEIAAAVVWLSSDAASFLTGVALPVDGGWVAR